MGGANPFARVGRLRRIIGASPQHASKMDNTGPLPRLILQPIGTSMGGRIMSANSLTSEPLRPSRRAVVVRGIESGKRDQVGTGASEPKIGMDSPHLEITVGGQTRQLPLDVPAVTVGRHQSNTLVLSDGMASRSHCVIEKAGNGTFRVRDLNSSNGTKLNGQIIRTAVLAPGDVITIGKTEIRLVGAANGEDVETLDEGDLVEIDADAVNAGNFGDMEAEGGGTGALRVSTEDVDYEHGLQSLAEQLPPGDFGESDIALVNARGVQIHEAGNPHRGKGRREPVDLFRLLLLVCFRSRTTDIHIEPRQDHYGVRLRID